MERFSNKPLPFERAMGQVCASAFREGRENRAMRNNEFVVSIEREYEGGVLFVTTLEEMDHDWIRASVRAAFPARCDEGVVLRYRIGWPLRDSIICPATNLSPIKADILRRMRDRDERVALIELVTPRKNHDESHWLWLASEAHPIKG